jgi:hypothetical protein
MKTKIDQHSWYGKHVHIFRSCGRVVRSTIKHLTVEDHGVYVRVEFLDKGKWKTKDVSAVCIAAVQVLWLNVDIVSDMEGSGEEDYDMLFEAAPIECDRLPDLSVDPRFLSDRKIRRVLECMSVEIRHLLKVPSGVSLMPRKPIPYKTKPRRCKKSTLCTSKDIP